MILVDTSAWVEYDRATGSAVDRRLTELIADDGRIDDPLAGRKRPDVDACSGRGLWMVNQLCELVQIRSTLTGTAVRMHFRRRRAR